MEAGSRLMSQGDVDNRRPASDPASCQRAYCPPVFDLPSLGAFALYLALSLLFFGRGLLGHFSHYYVGVGPDPSLMMWCLVWWPHAIANAINPFLTRAIWAPHGLNLAWQTSIPFASAIASPITLTAGPVVAYNILCLLSIPLDAWCAYLLCRYLSANDRAALVGGYVFGFSAFMLGHQVFGDLVLLLAFPVPLIAYLVALRLGNDITERRFTVFLTLLLSAQFLESLEIFATMALIGGISIALGWVFAKEPLKQRVQGLLKLIVLSYLSMALVVSPYLYYFFGVGFTSEPLWPPSFFSADLLNFVIPTRVNELGRIPALATLSVRFPGQSIAENGAYIGLPLIVVAVLYARHHWRKPLGRLLVDLLVIIAVLALGPVLHIAGLRTPIFPPWHLIASLPVIKDAMAVRLSMYLFLDLAVITSLWLASAEFGWLLQLITVVAIVLFTLPNLAAKFWVSPVDTPTFFSRGLYRSHLEKGSNVLVLPYGATGNAMLWQAQAKMYFSTPEGGAGVRVDNVLHWPIALAFYENQYVPDPGEQLKAFLAAHQVSAVIVAKPVFALWEPLMSMLGVSPVEAGGVWLYKLRKTPAPQVMPLLREMRGRFDRKRLRAIISATAKFLSGGGKLDSLDLIRFRESGLLDNSLIIGPPSEFDPSLSLQPQVLVGPHRGYGFRLSQWPPGHVAIGLYVWYSGVARLVDKLRSDTTAVYFPFARKLEPGRQAPKEPGWLVAVFTPQQLADAAATLAKMPASSLVGGPAQSDAPRGMAR